MTIPFDKKNEPPIPDGGRREGSAPDSETKAKFDPSFPSGNPRRTAPVPPTSRHPDGSGDLPGRSQVSFVPLIVDCNPTRFVFTLWNEAQL